MSRCRDDLTAITRYVTWNLDERSSGALSRALPDRTDMVAVYQVALQSSKTGGIEGDDDAEDSDSPSSSGALTSTKPLTPIPAGKKNVDRDYQNLLQLIEEAFMSRDANRTNLVVGGLVQHIVAQWREQFCKSVTTKFNCYFMLPFVDEFHRYIRKELQKVYDGDGDSMTDVFDLTAVRRSLEVQREELTNECLANKRLQEKFQLCARMMTTKQEAKDSVFDRV
jgi:hypothetical protein